MKHQLMFIGLLATLHGNAQQNTVTTGGNATGAGGSVSYSIGQIDYTSTSDANGTISQGLQQAYEIYSLTIDELFSSLEINLFPNPITDFVHLTFGEMSQKEVLNYQLTDASGRLIQTASIQEKDTQISVQDLEPASYFLTVLVSNKPAKTFTLIKNH